MPFYFLLLLSCSTSIKIVEDIDADGFASDIDCNDTDADIHPNAEEICNGIDDNCNQQIDADDPDAINLNEGFIDEDEDGFGVEPHIASCANVAPVAGDCDDTNSSVNPFANEYCNEIDDNCNGAVDEGALDSAQYFQDQDADGYGSAISSNWNCSPPEGYAAAGGDCDDANPTIYPNATEICDGLDNDCDGATDLDDDDVDPTQLTLYYVDADGDGYGDDSQTVYLCGPQEGYATEGGDCNDETNFIYPNKTSDVCNGIDEDCDGQIDENVKDGWQLVSIDTNANQIYDIDPSSGSTTEIIGISGNFAINSMDVSEGGNAIVHDYQNKKLWVLDACTAAITPLPVANPSISSCGIAFGPYNKLYGLDTSGDRLVEYNLQTGEASIIGALGISIGTCGLTYDCSQDRLIGANGSTGDIFTIDPITGQAYDIISTDVPFASVG
ncbi:MAG: putative metal-binding motif-containing protein, partial [Myxococcota bacterium]|nr:putative metal-binding motif-containing protein [Myxococcota bacterium]